MAQQETTLSSKPGPGPPIKCLIEHYRKEGVSSEAFINWLTTVHLPLGVPVMKKNGIVKYAVHYREQKVAVEFQALIDTVRAGWKVSDCDVVLEYWAWDMESLRNLVNDPAWYKTACEGEEKWVDLSKANIYVGYDTTYLDNGQIMNLVPK